MNDLATVRTSAKVFEDGVLGIKTATELAPGEYDAVVVLAPRAAVLPVQNTETPTTAIEPLERFLDRMRREHVNAALAQTGGNRTQAAKLLGVDVRTVFRLVDSSKSE